MNIADTDYSVKIPNRVWHNNGYKIVTALAQELGRENYSIVYRKNKKGEVIVGKPVTVVFTDKEHFVWFRLTVDLNKF